MHITKKTYLNLSVDDLHDLAIFCGVRPDKPLCTVPYDAYASEWDDPMCSTTLQFSIELNSVLLKEFIENHTKSA